MYDQVDQTVLSTGRQHRFSVVEMGAIKPGYLDRPIRVVRPKIAALTVIAQEHYSAFRTNEAVAAEKGKLITRLPADGIAVLNRDDPLVRSIGERRIGPVIWFGEDKGATLRLIEARSIWPEPLAMVVEFEGRRYDIATHLHGVHLTTPLLCAIGIGLAAGVPILDVINTLSKVTNSAGRMQVETGDDGITFVRDDFKAPQWSFQAPLRFMKDARARRKVVVVGTISDSPAGPVQRYTKAARAALEVADLVLLVGSHTISTQRANQIRSDGSLRLFPSTRDAAAFLKDELRAGDLVLLKGTNKTDHLVRIAINLRSAVQCWESSCRKLMFCDKCPRLHASETFRITPIATTFSPPAQEATRSDRITIIVGLGNPGDQQRRTAHNVGQLALDKIVERANHSWIVTRHGSESEFSIDGARVALVKLGRGMNRSGIGLKEYLRERGHDISDCIIVLDDADLPPGSAKIKRSGGDSGHKGMRSIIEEMSTDTVRRVRIGVSGQHKRQQAASFVLRTIDASDEPLIAEGLVTAERLVRELIAEQIAPLKQCSSPGADVVARE